MLFRSDHPTGTVSRVDALLEEARALVDAAQRVVVLTGAGISTDSGIPDFRGPNGVWTKDPEAEKLATLQHYVSDTAIRARAWRRRLETLSTTYEPNEGHRALVRLEERGVLDTLITQNVDGLHLAAGTSADKLVEIHGATRDVVCLTCDDRAPIEAALDRVRGGEPDPACRDCGGILKSDTISFGQQLVPEVIDRALRAAEEAEVLLAIGTSLQVYPVAGAVPAARAAGAKVVIVNAQPTPFDDIADAVLPGSISEILPRLCAGG